MEPVNIGIDLGGTNIQGAAARGDEILSRGKIATRAKEPATAVLDDIAKLALELAAGQPIAAVGLGLPGLLDPEKGICLIAENLGWQDVPVTEVLQEKLQAPVFIENDARVAALGELAQGKARGCKDFIYITVGTGIGSGIYIDGKLLRGSRWCAGEVGHMVMDPRGEECTCGNRGCLETLASAPAITRAARKAAAYNPESVLAFVRPEQIDAAAVFRAAIIDKIAAEIVDSAMTWLGIAIANLVNVFNPELVVIGGGVSLAGEELLQPIQIAVDNLCLRVQKNTVTITTSALGDRAGVAGALELIRQNLG